MKIIKRCYFFSIAILLLQSFVIQTSAFAIEDKKVDPRADYIRSHYSKYEFRIPMRDGIKLFTSVYVPNQETNQYPFLMIRTPYRVSPYGLNQYKKSLGPTADYEKEGFIFVFQDVRGKHMSEGEFVNMRPQDAYQRGKKATDDATDTYDTIEWLINNIPNNNGRVGMWGSSYPGYYTSVATINSHKALKAVSPQAPIADWFFDDFHRNGVFVTPMAFLFFDTFDKKREGLHSHRLKGLDMGTPDGYEFFKELGPLSNVNKKYFKGERPFWNELTEHPNYDNYWQARNILPHLKNTKPATLVVGGWYDTEDLYGPLATYQAMSKQNRKDNVQIVMGPWSHGQWYRGDGTKLGDVEFGYDVSAWYQENIQLPFFKSHLKGKGNVKLATATMFETGANRWRKFSSWPPKKTESKTLYLGNKEKLLNDKPTAPSYSDYVSDPNNPVPHSAKIGVGWDKTYMIEDQRFAARRPDVLTFETEVAENDFTIAGSIELDLWFSTSQTAADLVVKLVDVYPGKIADKNEIDKVNGNRHELVRWGSLRGRFRNSMSKPEAFKANEPTKVKFELYDVLHTIKRGHKLQIQIQSSLFPFLDLNPQTYVDNIFKAKESDFVKATHKIYHSPEYPSAIRFNQLK